MQSPFYRAMGGPYRRKLVKFGEAVLAQLPMDLEIPHRSWQTDGNLACGWARATSRTSTMSEQTMELKMREVYDDSQSTAGQKITSSHSSRPHRSRGRRQPMMQQNPKDEEANDHDGEDEDHGMTWREDASGARHNCDVELEPETEAHRNTRECVREQTADDDVTKATDHTC